MYVCFCHFRNDFLKCNLKMFHLYKVISELTWWNSLLSNFLNCLLSLYFSAVVWNGSTVVCHAVGVAMFSTLPPEVPSSIPGLTYWLVSCWEPTRCGIQNSYSVEVNISIQFLFTFLWHRKLKWWKTFYFPFTVISQHRCWIPGFGLSYYCIGTNYRSEDPVRLKTIVRRCSGA